MNFSELAKMYNVNETVMAEMANGVMSRLNGLDTQTKIRMQNDQNFAADIIGQAVKSWYEASQRYAEAILRKDSQERADFMANLVDSLESRG